MFSILGGFSAFNATSTQVEETSQPIKSSGNGLPLLLGLSYKIGASDIYITSNYRFLAGAKDILQRFGEEPSSSEINSAKVGYFSVDAHINYSFRELLNIDWLDIQSGIGLGYQRSAMKEILDIPVPNTGGQLRIGGEVLHILSGVYLSTRLLQARILLSPHFFIFVNNELNYAFLKHSLKGGNGLVESSNKKLKTLQYELAAGISFSF